MRKVPILVALGVIFTLAFAAPALADLFVELGPRDNIYDERRCPPDGDEEVLGRGGDDRLLLNQCGDRVGEPNANDSDADIGRGGRGTDKVRVNDGDIQDIAAGGGGGGDLCSIDVDLGADNQPGGTGVNEDVQDTAAASCERVRKNFGDFYTQT